MKKILIAIVVLVMFALPALAEYPDKWGRGASGSGLLRIPSIISRSPGWVTSITIVGGQTGQGIALYNATSASGTAIYQKVTAVDKTWNIPALFSTALYADNSPGVAYIVEYINR